MVGKKEKTDGGILAGGKNEKPIGIGKPRGAKLKME